MKTRYLFSILFLVSFFSKAQKAVEPLILFTATREFLNNSAFEGEAFAYVDPISAKHLRIKKIVDKNGKKLKEGSSAYAIQYKGENYFNLGYSTDLNNWTFYAKFDIVGRYCAIIIDDDTPAVIRKGGSNYPMGAAGALMKDSVKWGKAWLDKDGKKKRLLFIDTLKYEPESGSRNGGSIGNYLSRSEFMDILTAHKLDIRDRKVKELTFEEVIQLINELNVIDKV